MKNGMVKQALMATALVISVGGLPASAHAAGGSDLADWQSNYGSGSHLMPAWMISLLKMLG